MKKYLIPFFTLIVASLLYRPTLFADRYDEVNKYYLDAYNLYRSGKTEQSLELLKKVIEIDPDHAEAYFGMGSIYFRQNMFNEAVGAFTTVIRIKPEYAQAYERLWLAYKRLGMNDEAAEALQNYRKAVMGRMQAVTGELPQTAKPATQPSEEKPKEGEKSQSQEEKKANQPATDRQKVQESQPEETKILTTQEKRARQSPPTAPELNAGEPKPPVKETKRSETKIVKPSISQREDSRREAAKGAETSIQPSKTKSSMLFKNPLKKYLKILDKTYTGKVLKIFLYYTVTVQIWLCIVTSLFIYLLKVRQQKYKYPGRF